MWINFIDGYLINYDLSRQFRNNASPQKCNKTLVLFNSMGVMYDAKRTLIVI